MRYAQKISGVFRNTLSSRIGHTYLPERTLPRNSTDDLERQMYGMSVHDELVLKRILAMAGDGVLVEQDTFGIDRKNCPHYLRAGREIKVAKNPLTVDLQGEAHVSIIDESDNILSMRLSDFIHDMRANR